MLKGCLKLAFEKNEKKEIKLDIPCLQKKLFPVPQFQRSPKSAPVTKSCSCTVSLATDPGFKGISACPPH